MLLISIDTGVGSGRADLHKNAIDAAVAAGVRHIVYTSFVDLDNNDSPLAADHRLTEQFLRESGAVWTMLRNSLYANGLVTRAARMLADASATAAYTGGVAYVTREDCAAVAAVVLATDGHENRVYDITGPEVVLPQDVARATSEITGVTITVVEPEPTEPAPPGPGSASFAVVSTAVRDLTGRPPQSIRVLLEANRGLLLAPPP
jgi:NAD(P)H dehydrogenase (quinone)